MTLLVAIDGGASVSDIAARSEAKEVRPDARPQTCKNRRSIHRNTLMLFFRPISAQIVRGSIAAVERSMSE